MLYRHRLADQILQFFQRSFVIALLLDAVAGRLAPTVSQKMAQDFLVFELEEHFLVIAC